MKIRIEGTDEIKDLTICADNGIEWTADLIEAGGMPTDESDNIIMSQGDYDWWAEYISDTYRTEDEAKALADKIGMDYSDLMMEISAAMADTDMDGHRNAAVYVMDSYRS